MLKCLAVGTGTHLSWPPGGNVMESRKAIGVLPDTPLLEGRGVSKLTENW